jgi:hypothetical protein
MCQESVANGSSADGGDVALGTVKSYFSAPKNPFRNKKEKETKKDDEPHPEDLFPHVGTLFGFTAEAHKVLLCEQGLLHKHGDDPMDAKNECVCDAHDRVDKTQEDNGTVSTETSDSDCSISKDPEHDGDNEYDDDDANMSFVVEEMTDKEEFQFLHDHEVAINRDIF